MPTFAFVNGAALGGGLELALHCHYRTIAAHRARRLPRGLPRPGARLGRHAAAAQPDRHRPAVTVIVENALAQNTMLPAPKAAKLGIADARLRAGRLPRAVARVGGRRARRRRDRARAPRSTARPGTTRSPGPARSWPAAPATPPPARCAPSSCSSWPGPASTAMRSPPGRRPRTTRWPTCVMTDELRASLYAFDLVQQAGQAAGRRAGQVAGPEGHQGRRRRGGADGLAAGAAVRPPARGAGGPHRHRPGARGQGRRLRARRAGQAGRPRPAVARRAQPAHRAWSPAR